MADPTNSEVRGSPRALRRLLAFGGLLAFLVWRFLLRLGPGAAEQPVAAGIGSSQPEKPDTAFEPSDWSLGPVALVYAAMLMLLVISSFALMAAYPNALIDVDRTLRIAPPGPRLLTDPQDDMKRFRAEEEKWLDSYHWIDKQKGIVHIPIEEAMKKLARTGAPGFPERQQ
jgi:hypothetical protein